MHMECRQLLKQLTLEVVKKQCRMNAFNIFDAK